MSQRKARPTKVIPLVARDGRTVLTRVRCGHRDHAAEITAMVNGFIASIPRHDAGTIDILGALAALEFARRYLREEIDTALAQAGPDERAMFDTRLADILASGRVAIEGERAN